MHSIDYKIEVPFHDVDSMQICWHGHYVRYIELARCELLKSFDYGYRQMFESGYAWPVIDLQLRYVRPARFEQKIIVTAILEEWEYRLKIRYVIRCAETGERLTKASSTQVAVNMKTEEMCYRSPDVIFQCLGLNPSDSYEAKS